MRFDTPIFFQDTTPGEYNPNTGNYEPDIVTEDKKYADVTSAGAETLKLIYGELRPDSLVIRLQTHYETPIDRIRIGKKLYRVDFSRKLKTKHIFVVSEVQ